MNWKNLLGVQTWMAIGLSLALVSGCSSKKPTDEGDMATTDAGMNPTDLSGVPGVGQKIPELGPIYFAYDSFALTGEARRALDAHAAWLKANGSVNVQVEGHCDERGTTEYNLALGERRASTVRDYLTSQGVPGAQVSSISYGEERPAVQGADESAWSQNRRAEFVSAGR